MAQLYTRPTVWCEADHRTGPGLMDLGEKPFHALRWIKENGYVGRRWRGLLRTPPLEPVDLILCEHRLAAYNHRRTEAL
jgi:hypothetical protein